MPGDVAHCRSGARPAAWSAARACARGHTRSPTPPVQIVLTPAALLSYARFESVVGAASRWLTSPLVLVAAALFVATVVVAGDYVKGELRGRAQKRLFAPLSLGVAFVFACGFAGLRAGDAQVTFPLFVGFGFVLVGYATTLSSAGEADGGHGGGGGGGVLDGGGDGPGLPLYAAGDDDDPARRVPLRASLARYAVGFRKVLRYLLDNRDSRRILMFLSINMAFMFVEVVVGFMSNSLGLISDAGHMFFDNSSLFIGLYASYMSHWRPDDVFSYGYARYEVLAGFVNAIFLVFVAVTVVLEGFERLYAPPEIHSEHLLMVRALGVGVVVVESVCGGGGRRV